MANFKSSPLRGRVQGGKGQESGLAAYVAGQIDRSLSWKDLAWIRTITKLPLVLKGFCLANKPNHLALESDQQRSFAY